MRNRAVLGVMIAPAIVLFIFTFLAPFIITGRLSLYDSDYMTREFIGLKNFGKAFKDYYFQKSFFNAFAIMVFTVPLQVYAAYRFAMILATFADRTQAGFRLALYLPSLAAGVVMALLWRWMLQRDGLINQITALFGAAPVLWMAYAWPARVAMAMIALSGNTGALVLLLAAALCRIPAEVYDAAIIDGANTRQYRRYILRPLIMPMILLIVMLTMVEAMQVWETIFVLWKSGGPEGSVASPVYEIFRTAFELGQQGYAAAKGLIFLVVIAVMLAIKQRIEKWVKV